MTRVFTSHENQLWNAFEEADSKAETGHTTYLVFWFTSGFRPTMRITACDMLGDTKVVRTNKLIGVCGLYRDWLK